MEDIFSRTILLLGEDKFKKLVNSNILIVGVGGVGSFVAEALVRAGVGKLTLIDADVISYSNINRQIHATTKTVGLYKTEVMKERLISINPNLQVITNNIFIDENNIDNYLFSDYDYIIDAIDSVKSKINLILNAKAKDIKIISSMGAGNKLDPTKFSIADISKTNTCPLARVIRKELKKHSIYSLKTLFSTEEPIKQDKLSDGKLVPGSISFVPSVAGLIIASEVVKDLIK